MGQLSGGVDHRAFAQETAGRLLQNLLKRTYLLIVFQGRWRWLLAFLLVLGLIPSSDAVMTLVCGRRGLRGPPPLMHVLRDLLPAHNPLYHLARLMRACGRASPGKDEQASAPRGRHRE